MSLEYMHNYGGRITFFKVFIRSFGKLSDIIAWIIDVLPTFSINYKNSIYCHQELVNALIYVLLTFFNQVIYNS
jgi:hypothetical protein